MPQFTDRLFAKPLTWDAWTQEFSRPRLSEGEATQLLYLGTTLHEREFWGASPVRINTDEVLSGRLKFYIDAGKSQNQSFAYTARDLTVKYWLRQVAGHDYTAEFSQSLQFAFEFLCAEAKYLSRPPHPAIVQPFVQGSCKKIWSRFSSNKPVPDSLFESLVRCILQWAIPDLLTTLNCPNGAHEIVLKVLKEWGVGWDGIDLCFSNGRHISDYGLPEPEKVRYRRALEALLYLTARNYSVVDGKFVEKEPALENGRMA